MNDLSDKALEARRAYYREYTKNHPEYRKTTRNTKRSGMLNILKRINNIKRPFGRRKPKKMKKQRSPLTFGEALSRKRNTDQ